MIDGYRQISINVSLMETLKKLKDEKGYSSYNKVLKYLVEYYEEATRVKL
jgi:hypothetical protein